MNTPILRFKEFSGEWSNFELNSILKPNIIEIDKPNKGYWRLGLRSHNKGTFHTYVSDPSKNSMEKLYKVQENNFIVNITFAWEQAYAVTKQKDVEKLVSHRFPTYNFIDGFSPKFFEYAVSNKKFKHLLDLASPGGAGRNRVLNKKAFLKINKIIPSLEEQNKIASFLSLVDKRIELQEDKINKLEEYKKGMMQKIFTQEIRFQDEIGKEYPKWEITCLKSLGNIYGGLSGKTAKDFEKGNSKYITYMDVFKNCNIKYINHNYVSIREDEKQNKVNYGDVLFTQSSETLNEIAMSTVWLNKEESPYLNSFCFGFRIKDKTMINPIYFSYLLRDNSARKKIVREGQGSTRYNISPNRLMNINLTVSTEIAEQKKIADFLMLIDLKIEKENNLNDKLNELKKGLLQQMFV